MQLRRGRLQAIREPEPEARVARWVELGAGLRLVLTPLDIAEAFARLLGREERLEQMLERRLREAGTAIADGQRHLPRAGARRLSPGGSADLLACAWFLLQQEVA